METIISVLTSLIITLQTVFSLIPSAAGCEKSYSPEYDSSEMSVVFIADIHADGNCLRDRTNILRETFAGINERTERPDAVVCAGDITNGGSEIEYFNLTFLKSFYLGRTKFLPAMGNHDSWRDMDTVNHTDENYPLAKFNYLSFLNLCCGYHSLRPYFTTEVKDCGFIIMGTEDTHQDESVISDEQMKFLEESLCKYQNSGKPVFVICHQPLNGRNGCSSCWSDYSERSAEIDALLQKYASVCTQPIFYVSGHVHDISENTLEEDSGVYYLNLPSTEYTDGGGIGFVLEMNGEEISLRGRNFRTDEWLEDYSYHIDRAS